MELTFQGAELLDIENTTFGVQLAILDGKTLKIVELTQIYTWKVRPGKFQSRKSRQLSWMHSRLPNTEMTQWNPFTCLPMQRCIPQIQCHPQRAGCNGRVRCVWKYRYQQIKKQIGIGFITDTCPFPIRCLFAFIGMITKFDLFADQFYFCTFHTRSRGFEDNDTRCFFCLYDCRQLSFEKGHLRSLERFE